MTDTADAPAEVNRLDSGDRAALTDDELCEAYPWPDGRPWVRAMMVTTLDGASVGADGLSGSISSPADKRVFVTVRRFADAVLIGSGTLRAEEYTPLRATAADAAVRSRAGQNHAPTLVVVSASLDLPWHLPVWSQSDQRVLVLTGPDASPKAVENARQHADVVTLDATTPGQTLAALRDRGFARIVCEGGPSLLRDLVAAGLVDELDISVAPHVVGTRNSPDTAMLPQGASARLEHVLTGGDFLMTRYLVDRA